MALGIMLMNAVRALRVSVSSWSVLLLFYSACPTHCTTCTWDASVATTTCTTCKDGYYAATDGTCKSKTHCCSQLISTYSNEPTCDRTLPSGITCACTHSFFFTFYVLFSSSTMFIISHSLCHYYLDSVCPSFNKCLFVCYQIQISFNSVWQTHTYIHI